MDAAVIYYVHRPGHRGWHRWNKHGRAISALLLHDESGNERLLDLDQGWLKARTGILIRETGGEAAQSCVARQFFEKFPFGQALGARAKSGLNRGADDEAKRDEQQNRDDF